ncbi:unnamed protein product [Jaminaea pallidilutea]
MVNLRRVEDRPTPKEVYNWRLWALAAIAASNAIMIGYDSAFVGGAITLKGFTNDFGKIPLDTSANLVTTYQAGAFFGAFVGYPMGYYWGRKWGIFIAALVFTIGSIIMVIASPSTGLGPIYAGRAIAGLAIGAASNLGPIYIAEISVPSIRGQLVGLYEMGWQIGGIVGFFINYGVALHIPNNTVQWRIPFAVQLIPGGLLVIGSLFLVESPRWLLQRGNKEAASRALCKIRKLDETHPYLVEELGEMSTAVETEQRLLGSTSFWAPFRQTFLVKRVLWRLVLGSSLFAFQNGTGINAINYYSPTVFKSLGITGANTGLLTTGIFGVIKTVGALVWIFFLIDRVGRRRILYVGAAGGAAAMLAIAIYIAVDKPAQRPVGAGIDAPGRFALACFYIWTAFYASTWNGTPWVVGSEIFPQQSRTLGMACMAASNWLWNFVIARATPYAFADINWGFYLIFCCCMLISIPYIYFALPETKGIPLEHMDELFAARPVRHANDIVFSKLRSQHAGLDTSETASHESEEKDAGYGTETRLA